MNKNIDKHSYMCSFPNCGRVFKTNFSMKRHMLIHNPDKNYICAHCGKKFVLSQYLKEHIYTHTKDKPYICGVAGCNKKFRQAGKLSLHRRTHKEYTLKYHDCQPIYAKSEVIDKEESAVRKQTSGEIVELENNVTNVVSGAGRQFMRQDSGRTTASENFNECSKNDTKTNKVRSNNFMEEYFHHISTQSTPADLLTCYLNNIDFFSNAGLKPVLPLPYKVDQEHITDLNRYSEM